MNDIRKPTIVRKVVCSIYPRLLCS